MPNSIIVATTFYIKPGLGYVKIKYWLKNMFGEEKFNWPGLIE